jgi:hypothetical protein
MLIPQNEQKLLSDLHKLTDRALEAVVFLRLIVPFLENIIALGTDLMDYTFEHLISLDKGQLISQQLVTGLVRLEDSFPDHKIEIEKLKASLKHLCPKFFNEGHQTQMRCREMISNAAKMLDTDAKAMELERSLEELLPIADQIPVAEICEAFLKAHYYLGIVKLVLQHVSLKDPKRKMLLFANPFQVLL